MSIKTSGCYFCGLPSGHMGDCPSGLPPNHRNKLLWWNGWLLGFCNGVLPTRPTRGLLTGWMIDPNPVEKDGRILTMGWIQGCTT